MPTEAKQFTRNFIKFIIEFKKLRFMLWNQNFYLTYNRKYVIYFRYYVIGIMISKDVD